MACIEVYVRDEREKSSTQKSLILAFESLDIPDDDLNGICNNISDMYILENNPLGLFFMDTELDDVLILQGNFFKSETKKIFEECYKTVKDKLDELESSEFLVYIGE